MNELWKRIISAFLVLVMVFQMVPVTSLAAEHQDEPDDTVNWDMPEPEEPDVVGEVEELRDHTSKQFRLSDGSFAAVNYGIPVHYLDEYNNWVDVDNTLTYSATAGQYMSINGDEQRGFADTLTNGQPVLVSQYENYSVELTLLPMTYETVRDEVVVMDQEEDMADAAASEPVSEATEAPETEPPIEETEYTEPVETTVPEETNPEITEPTEATEATEPSEPELSGEAESTSETLGTDAEAEESEATEVPTEPVEETEGTEDPIETEVTEPVPETTTPEATVPETTLPEETVHETTIPEETVIAQTSEPEDLEETVTETVMPSSVSAIVLNPGEASVYSSREDMPLSEQVLPEKMGSHVIYEGVFPGIDLMYENYGYNIKETILVNELQESYTYSFLLTAEGLTATLTDSGSITLNDVDGEIVYEIPAPYMFDAAGETSYDVEYSLEEMDGDYILTVTADAEWIEDGERALPVSIDPTIQLKCEYVNNGTLYTTHVVEGDPNLAHNGDDEQYIGYGMGYNSNGTTTIKECQIYTHVARLPDVPAGCEMVEATLQFYNYGDSGYSYIGNCSTLEIAAYPVTEDNSNGNYKSWIEGLKWSTRPDFDNTEMIDFAVASDSTEGSYIQWDVTKQVEKWYADSTITNRTLALVGYEAASNGYNGNYCAVAVLKGFGTTNPPALIVKYRSAIGLESYYTAQSQNVGAAGTAYVSDYTGQLMVVKNVASHASVIMPFSLNLVYNSYYRDTRFKEARSTGMYFGNGWKLDAVQTLSTCTGDLSNYMLYIDGDGTYHYFLKNGSVWEDEDGLDLTISSVKIKDSGGIERGDGFEIVSGQGDRLRFYKGLLVQQMDSNGNKIFYVYNNSESNASGTAWLPTGSGDKLTKVIQRNDGTTSDIILAELTYDASGYLTKVSDRMGNVTTMTYSSQKLEKASNDNGQVAQYAYSGNNLVQAIDISSGYVITYKYNQNRISSILESGSANGTNWEDRIKILVDGSKEVTTYRSPGPDGVISNTDDLLTTYLFDDEGRTINCYTTNAGETVVYGAATGAYAQTNSDSVLNNHLLNSASIGTAAQNLLVNGNFETTTDPGWTLDIGTGSGKNMALRTDGHRTGNSALKTYFNASTTGTLHASKKVTGLISGQTYTLSGYVNTTEITAYGSGGGIYLSVSSGGSGTSETIDYVTNASIDNGWERLSVTFKATSTSAVVNVYTKNAVGIAYIDDLQVETDDAPSNVNLVTNGVMNWDENNHDSIPGWIIKTDNVSTDSSGGIGGGNATAIASTPLVQGYLYQTIPINLPYTQTYVLSGWAKANALPNNQPKHYNVKLFTLKAEVYYSDGEKEDFFLPFSSEIDGEWQFVSGVIVPSRKLTVTKILVYCAYHYNVGTALFDNVSLVREPAQTMKYDSKGNLVSVTTMDLDTDINTYENGNLIQAVTSGHGTFDYTYDNTYSHRLTSVTNGVVTQSMGYDSYGNVNKTTLSGSGSKQIVTSAKYTDSGNLTQSVTNAAGKTTSYAYGSDLYKQLGAASAVTTPYGTGKTVTTNHTYDHVGRVTESSIASLVKLRYNYNTATGNLDSIQRSDTNGNNVQTYGLTYNLFGDVLNVRVGTKELVRNEYGDSGLLLKQTYGNGNSVSYEYDSLGRVEKTVQSGSSANREITNIYNGNGAIYQVSDDRGTSSAGDDVDYLYNYDTINRLIGSKKLIGDSVVLRTSTSYDSCNRISAQAWCFPESGGTPTSYSETYTYQDTDGLLTRVDGDGFGDYVYTYDTLSRISTKYSYYVLQTYSYADAGTNTTSQVSSIAYTKRPGGTNLSEFTLGYAYDDAGYIKSVTNSGKSDDARSYTYDAQGQMLTEKIGSKTYTYTYDAFGNIISASDGTTKHTYTYGNSDWRDLLTAYDSHSIVYDNAGNPTSYYNGNSWTFGWQNGRHLVSAKKGSTQTSYTYDADGIRDSKTVGSVKYNFITMNGRVVRQTWNGNTLDIIYDVNGSPYACKYNGTYYIYVLNLQGDVIRIVDSTGATKAEYQYDAWGKVLTATGTMAEINPLRYRGYYYDTETGFYYLQSRYYDPAIGRFINADSFASTGQGFLGYNMFAYCRNNPVCRVDISGFADDEADLDEDTKDDLFPQPMGGGTNPDPVIGTSGGNGGQTIHQNSSNTSSNDITIYRYGGTAPSNLKPRLVDVSSGLSFSTVRRSGAAQTTIESVNATGNLWATKDGPYHVSVTPTNGTMVQWYEQGAESQWTETLKSIVSKAR